MPRSPRIEYEGGFCHVLCRGYRREPIFRDDRDRRNFLEALGEACERSGAFVCSYVLMDNHSHQLLETPLGNLVATMTWLQSTVTRRFNARHRFLFERATDGGLPEGCLASTVASLWDVSGSTRNEKLPV